MNFIKEAFAFSVFLMCLGCTPDFISKEEALVEKVSQDVTKDVLEAETGQQVELKQK